MYAASWQAVERKACFAGNGLCPCPEAQHRGRPLSRALQPQLSPEKSTRELSDFQQRLGALEDGMKSAFRETSGLGVVTAAVVGIQQP